MEERGGKMMIMILMMLPYAGREQDGPTLVAWHGLEKGEKKIDKWIDVLSLFIV